MPGPPPQKNARRRNFRPDWKVLPRDGYDGPIPSWPVAMRKNAQATRLWRDLWRTPQAAAWADLGWERSVARYALVSIDAEAEGAPASLLAEVRQMEDRLGLSPMSMKRLQWEIGEDPKPVAREFSEGVAGAMDYV